MAQLAAMPQSNGLANIAQLIQQLAPVFLGTGAQNQSGSQQQTSGGTTTQTSAVAPDILGQIQQLLGQITNTGQQFTRENAIADSTGAINTQILDAIRANMPSVLGGQKAAGLYNDTTTTLLQNDLMARIAGEAQKAQQQTIQNYGQLATQNQNTAANLLGALAQANKTQTQTATQTDNRTSNQQTSTAPVIPTGATAGGLGLLGALSLAKNSKDLLSGASNLFKGFGGGAEDAALPAFDFGFTTPDVSNFFSTGQDLVSGGSTLGGAFDFGGSNFGNFADFGTSGISDVASTLGSFSGVEPGLAGVFTDAGSDALNLGTGISSGLDFFGGLGKGVTDLFGDFGSYVGDLFGGFFADGGLVTKDPRGSIISDFELHKLPPDSRLMKVAQRMADGGIVKKGFSPRTVKGYADGGVVTRGRAGGKSYTAEGAEAKATGGFGNIQRARALWEEMARGGSDVGGPRFDAPTTIAGNEAAAGGAVNAPTIVRNTPSLPMPSMARLRAIEEALTPVRTAQQQAQQAAEPSDLKQIGQGVSQAKQSNNLGNALVGAPGSANVAIASGIDGASAALEASPYVGTAAGAGTAAGTGATLGTVDTLGSILGTGSYLPTYGAASSAAGTGATSPLFTSAAGEGAGAATSGLSSSLASTGVGAVAALLVNSFLPIIFGGFSGSREGNEAIAAALNPEETMARSSNIFGEGGLSRNFLRRYYGDLVSVDSGNPAFRLSVSPSREAITEAYQRAQADIQAGNFGQDINEGERSKVQAGLTALNEYVANNPQVIEQAYQPHYAPGNPIFEQYQQMEQAGTLPPNAVAPTVAPEYQINPDGSYVGGDLAYLDAQRQAGNSGATFLADGGMIGNPKNDPKGRKDNVPIMASEGEFVIPKPVVDSIGQDFFQKLIDAFNVPAVQR